MTALTEEKIGVADWGLRLFFIGLGLIVVGFVLVVLGTLLQPPTSASSSFGGVVLVGPIPILFGGGPEASTLIIVGLLVAILLALVGLLVARRS